MSLRDLAVTLVVGALLPAAFLRPWIGVLLWSWLGYMNPHRLTWGFARTFPFAQLVAIATLLGLLVTRERKSLPRAAEVYLLAAMWAHFALTTFFAARPPEAWEQFDKVSKILLFTFVTLVLFQDARKLRLLVWVTAASIGFYGLKGGIWALTTGVGNQVLGPEGSFIGGNTEIGLALNMVLPLLLLLSREERQWWVRRGLQATTFFSVVAVLFTHSRGALLGVLVVVPLMFLKTRMRLLVLPLALVGYVVAEPLASAVMPEAWLAKMGTISEYERDLSARMRLNAWQVAWMVGLDHPLLGLGFRPFSPDVYERYTPGVGLNTYQDAHSIWFQVLAEHGFLGLGLYVSLIASTLLSLRRVMGRARREPSLAPLGRCAQMVEVSLVGYLVSGTFLSMSYFDLFYGLVAIAVLLKVLAARPAAAPEAAAPASGSAPGRRPPPGPAGAPRLPACPHLRAPHGQAGREGAVAEFGLDRMAGRYAALYRAPAGRPSRWSSRRRAGS